MTFRKFSYIIGTATAVVLLFVTFLELYLAYNYVLLAGACLISIPMLAVFAVVSIIRRKYSVLVTLLQAISVIFYIAFLMQKNIKVLESTEYSATLHNRVVFLLICLIGTIIAIAVEFICRINTSFKNKQMLDSSQSR